MIRAKGSNQFKAKYRYDEIKACIFLLFILLSIAFVGLEKYRANNFTKSVVVAAFTATEAYAEEVEVTPTPTAIPTATPTPTISELESIVSYITRVFEKEGKQVVVEAITCFYSESGLRPTAVGQNTDIHQSKDHGVAQLNDYWHKLTPQQKTDYKANIDKAYEIYKSRGNWSAWYGRGCN